jgi:hypothetical protein
LTQETWWTGLAPAETTVECSGTQHRIRWAEGELKTLDHEDPQGERALAALAGEPCPCVQILGDWEHYCTDLSLLILGPRGGTDPLGSAGWRRQMVGRRSGRRVTTSSVPGPVGPRPHQVGSGSGLRRVGAGPVAFAAPLRPVALQTRPTVAEDPRVTLLSLGGALPDRLLATVLATWADRLSAGDERALAERSALAVALYGRAAEAIRGWLGDSELPVSVEMIADNETSVLTRVDDRLHAMLTFGWLSQIWARDLSVVLGRFALYPIEVTDERRRVWTVGPDLADGRPITIAIDD